MALSVDKFLSKAKKYYATNRIKDCYKLFTHSMHSLPSSATPQHIKDFYLCKGLCETHIGLWSEAEKNIMRSLEACKQIGTVRFIYNQLDNLTTIYMSTRQYDKAINCVNESLILKLADRNEEAISLGYLQLAQIFFTIESFQAASDSLKKAGHYIRLYNQEQQFKYWHFIHARQLRREGKLNEAVGAYTKALQYASRYNDFDSALRCLANRGGILIDLKEWKKAEKDITEAINLGKKNNQNADIVSYYITLAKILLAQQRYTECLSLCEQILTPSNITNEQPNVLRDAAELQARLHKALGQPEKALEHYEEYIKYYRKTYDSDLNSSLLNLQAKYESEKKERELQQAQLQKVESELRALRAQMNPHFVFNALSSIRKQILKGDTEIADDYIVRFSRLLRLILDSTRTPLVKLSDNITMLDLYMQIEQARQNNGFSYSIKVPATLNSDELYIPGMVLQPIIENAIVHGLFPKQKGKGQLSLSFAKNKTVLKVTITDNGVGRAKPAKAGKNGHQSQALNIVKETLDLAWGSKSKKEYIQISDKKNSKGKATGTTVQVLLPLHLKP